MVITNREFLQPLQALSLPSLVLCKIRGQHVAYLALIGVLDIAQERVAVFLNQKTEGNIPNVIELKRLEEYCVDVSDKYGIEFDYSSCATDFINEDERGGLIAITRSNIFMACMREDNIAYLDLVAGKINYEVDLRPVQFLRKWEVKAINDITVPQGLFAFGK